MTARPWTGSYGDIPTEIDADDPSSLLTLMEGAMQRYADRVAFRSAGHALTYAQVDRLSAAFCAYLQHRLGVRPGDRVAVMSPNLAAFPVAFLGIVRAGGVQVNVNPLYTPRELEHQLNDAGCEVIVIFAGATPTLAEVIDRTGIRAVVTLGVGDALGVHLPGPAVDARLKSTIPFAAALDQGAALPRTPVALTGEDLLFLQYTGGTTGVSKGAALSHRNLVANTAQFKAFMEGALRPGEEVIVTALPLYHIFALMVNFISYFSVGAENWLVANPREMDGFVDVLKRARPTVIMGVNTLYAGLTQHPRIAEVDWSRLVLAGGGGSAIVGTTSARWRAITGTFIREGYGLSETSPVVSFNPRYITEFNGTTGLPLPSTDVRLLDEDGSDAPVGEPGEVVVKGPQVMGGYWNQPEANRAAFTEDGYFRTGDIGVFDERGFLRIVDRKKDMVIVSGFNVYPNEIEAIASSCTGVAECACIGVPDERTGEAVRLFVVKIPGAAVSEADLIAHCRFSMTAYKVPKSVRFIEALPKTAVGKILRRELRHVA
jgi:long-chain acyl-CoA synthetase